MKPLLKWAGGKRALLGALSAHIPENFNTYFEPFFGGGALFFALSPPRAILGDINEELINCYVQVRDDPEGVIAALRTHKNSSDNYYMVRGSHPRSPNTRAARTIYLTALSFNGIYRLNLKGIFNVPYGHKAHVDPCDAQHIRAISEALTGASLMSGDFEAVLKSAKRGDLIYLDPPYTVAHGNNGFVKYNEKIFSWDDQQRLANLAKSLANRGCHVVVSNADHPSVKALYKDGFKTHSIVRHSVMAAAADHRREIRECIFVGDNDAYKHSHRVEPSRTCSNQKSRL